jgi:hypothetical protein
MPLPPASICKRGSGGFWLPLRKVHLCLLLLAVSAILRADIVPSNEPLTLGPNWFPYESFKGESFRWVDNDAAFTLSGAARKLTIDLQPGPGTDFKPFLLRVFDAKGKQIQQANVQGRVSLTLALPATGTYKLHAEGGGRKTPHDPRVLNFRVFRFSSGSSGPAATDITGSAVTLGQGWYPIERFGVDLFRWVNNDAVFTTTGNRLVTEVEPGAGMGGKPLPLRVLDASGKQVQAVELRSRQTITLLLPHARGTSATYRFHIDGGGRKIPSDPRILNFRVMQLKPAE